ncbi:MAG: phosphoethanolamine transferase, partial [Desulfovibrionaceae bacterium]|nr:phosphoethanolamine transferase [Desulfovibrionaceae bacterium]
FSTLVILFIYNFYTVISIDPIHRMCYTLFLFTLAFLGIDITLRSYLAHASRKGLGVILYSIAFISLVIIQIIFFSIPLTMIGYNVLFGRKVDMDFFFPIFQTNIFEVQEFVLGFLPYSVWIYVFIFCGVMWYIQRKSIVHIGRKKTYYLGVCSCVLLVLLVTLNIQRHLILYTMYVDAKHVYYSAPLAYTLHREENIQKLKINELKKKGLYVVIIGESATRLGWGAYGYYRDTTPFISSNLTNPNYVLINRAYSPADSTEQSLFYVLTSMSQYIPVNDTEILSIVDVLKKAGLKTIWISNHGVYNTNSAKVRSVSDEADIVISDIEGKVQVQQYDEYLLPYIEKVLHEEEHEGGTVLFIHLYGSHLRFYHRYDRAKYSIFSDTPRYEEGKNIDPASINHYDNSIYATDDLLRRITEMVENRDDFEFLVYVSDHGEGVYKGVLRGNPQSFPDVIEVPLYFYMSNKYIKEHKERVEILRTHATQGYSTDMLFDTLLGLFTIEGNWYRAEHDLSSPLYMHNYETLKTKSGTTYVHSLFTEKKDT